MYLCHLTNTGRSIKIKEKGKKVSDICLNTVRFLALITRFCLSFVLVRDCFFSKVFPSAFNQSGPEVRLIGTLLKYGEFFSF